MRGLFSIRVVVLSVCTAFSNQGVVFPAGVEKGDAKETSQGPLRVVRPFSNGDTLWMNIVGTYGNRLQADELRIDNISPKNNGKALPATAVQVHPARETKYGPCVAVTIDASKADGPILVDGAIAYKGKAYQLRAEFRKEGAVDEVRWTLVSVELAPK